jgi:hypothetical protein
MWVIFPYRFQPGKEREVQLNAVWDAISRRYPHAQRCVVQQSTGRPFNRGLLLDIGFQVCCSDNTWVIFHDVDLLPDKQLLESYQRPRESDDSIVHIGRRFQRYTSKTYFGGIHAMRGDTFIRLNGFPCCFWGWGGEDDEFLRRCKKHETKIVDRLDGSVADLENMDLSDKLKQLTDTASKCTNKRELLQKYRDNPDLDQEDGLSQVWLHKIRVSVERTSARTVQVYVATY